MKARACDDGKGNTAGYMIFCPACECGHLFYINYGGKPAWTFNGDVNKPTFAPSMLVYEQEKSDPNCEGVARRQARCHSFVTDGKIQFLDDCTHAMRGQTVELPDF